MQGLRGAIIGCGIGGDDWAQDISGSYGPCGEIHYLKICGSKRRQKLKELSSDQRYKELSKIVNGILPRDFPKEDRYGYSESYLLLTNLYEGSLDASVHAEGDDTWPSWKDYLSQQTKRASKEGIELRQRAMENYTKAVLDNNEFAIAVIFFGSCLRGREGANDLDVMTISVASDYPYDRDLLCALLRLAREKGQIQVLRGIPEIERLFAEGIAEEIPMTNNSSSFSNGFDSNLDQGSSSRIYLDCYRTKIFQANERGRVSLMKELGLPENPSIAILRAKAMEIRDEKGSKRLLSLLAADAWAEVYLRTLLYTDQDKPFLELQRSMRELQVSKPELFKKKKGWSIGELIDAPPFELQAIHLPFVVDTAAEDIITGPFLVVMRQADSGAVRSFFSSGNYPLGDYSDF